MSRVKSFLVNDILTIAPLSGVDEQMKTAIEVDCCQPGQLRTKSAPATAIGRIPADEDGNSPNGCNFRQSFMHIS